MTADMYLSRAPIWCLAAAACVRHCHPDVIPVFTWLANCVPVHLGCCLLPTLESSPETLSFSSAQPRMPACAALATEQDRGPCSCCLGPVLLSCRLWGKCSCKDPQRSKHKKRHIAQAATAEVATIQPFMCCP